MMLDDFILIENPSSKEKDMNDIFDILDEVRIDPLERELIRKRLTQELKKEGNLPYCGGLVKEYIEFYERYGIKPLAIEIIGMNNILLQSIGNAFVRILRPYFKCKFTEKYKTSVVACYNIALVGTSNRFDYSYKKQWKKIVKDRLKEMKERPPSLLMEVIGLEKIKNGKYYYILLVVYDRHHNKHGYVALKF
jgi:hypothetical protein